MTTKIYFKGYYGYKNIGDDIFCVTADWVTNKYLRENKAIFVGENLPLLSNNAIRINIKNTFLRKFTELFITFYADKIIYFGGSVFNNTNLNFPNIKYFLLNCNFLSKKLSTYGTSIGPFKNKEDKINTFQFLSKFNKIVVRDYSSLNILEEKKQNLNYLFGFDIAILLKEVYPKLIDVNKNNNRNRLGVSLCYFERHHDGSLIDEENRLNSVEDFLVELAENRKIYNIDEIVFFEFNGNENNGDLELTEKVAAKLKSKIKTKIVHYNSDTEKFCMEFAEMDYIVGMRLHSGIMAYALDIPFLLVEYHKKSTEFLNTINHNYRFTTADTQSNLITFKKITDLGKIPNIQNPEKFKKIFKSSLECRDLR